MKSLALLILTLVTPVCLLAQMQNDEVSKRLSDFRTARRYAEAIKYLTALIEASPEDAELYSQRAEFRLFEAATGDAIADASKAVALKPNEPGYYLLRARVFNSAYGRFPYRSDFLSAMKKDVNAALSIDPVTSTTFRRATEELEAAGEWSEAIRYSDRFVERGEFILRAYEVRYRSKFKLKDYEGSLNDAIKSVELIAVVLSDNNSRRIAYGNFYKKEFSVIEPILRVYLKDHKLIDQYYARAMSAFEVALHDDQRLASLDTHIPSEAIRYGPTPANQLSRLVETYATLLESKEDFKGSEKHLDRLVTFKPNWRGQHMRSLFYQRRGRTREAINDLTYAIAYAEQDQKRWELERYFYAPVSYPGYHQWIAMIREYRGDLYASQSNFKRALEDYEKAISTFPGSKDRISNKLDLMRSKLN
jgi:tetratricopeptide (TPR) repeat protein